MPARASNALEMDTIIPVAKSRTLVLQCLFQELRPHFKLISPNRFLVKEGSDDRRRVQCQEVCERVCHVVGGFHTARLAMFSPYSQRTEWFTMLSSNHGNASETIKVLHEV